MVVAHQQRKRSENASVIEVKAGAMCSKEEVRMPLCVFVLTVGASVCGEVGARPSAALAVGLSAARVSCFRNILLVQKSLVPTRLIIEYRCR